MPGGVRLGGRAMNLARRPVRFRLPMHALLLSCLFALGASAQTGGTLTGAVAAEEGGPLVGATVAMYDGGAFVTGAATGLDGRCLDGVPAATYRVRISFVGYTSWERGDVTVRARETTDLGTVALIPDAAQLGETEVTAARLIEQRADRTVYNVADQPVTAGGSALDALQTLPSIEVDTEGALSLRVARTWPFTSTVAPCRCAVPSWRPCSASSRRRRSNASR